MGRKAAQRERVELKRIALDIIPELYDAIDQYCEARGLLKTEFYRYAILEYCEQKNIFKPNPN